MDSFTCGTQPLWAVCLSRLRTVERVRNGWCSTYPGSNSPWIRGQHATNSNLRGSFGWALKAQRMCVIERPLIGSCSDRRRPPSGGGGREADRFVEAQGAGDHLEPDCFASTAFWSSSMGGMGLWATTSRPQSGQIVLPSLPMMLLSATYVGSIFAWPSGVQ